MITNLNEIKEVLNGLTEADRNTAIWLLRGRLVIGDSFTQADFNDLPRRVSGNLGLYLSAGYGLREATDTMLLEALDSLGECPYQGLIACPFTCGGDCLSESLRTRKVKIGEQVYTACSVLPVTGELGVLSKHPDQLHDGHKAAGKLFE